MLKANETKGMMIMIDDFKEQFVEEVDEHLNKIEFEILNNLIESNADVNSLNDFFRCIHSIKGGAGIIMSMLTEEDNIFRKVRKISDVTHSFEDFLLNIRQNKLSFNNEAVKLSYEFIDFMRSCVEYIIKDTSLPVNLVNEGEIR